MIKRWCYKNILIYGIFILLIGTSVVPRITGNIDKNGIQLVGKVLTGILLNDDYKNAYWKFDECYGNILRDYSGHDYDGTIYGATWTTNGYSGCALDFDGTNDYVDLSSYSDELGINKTDDVIFSFWFKSTNSGLIYSSTGYENVPELRIELHSNGSIMFKVWTSMCGLSVYSYEDYNDGDWHYSEIYFNGITANPTIEVFVDEDLDGSITDWLCEIENNDFQKTKIGSRASEETGHFDGIIDEFNITKYEQGNKQKPPTIDGPTIGKPNIEYDYTFVTDDPENDSIWLYIDWDDDDPDERLGPYQSGEEVIVGHKWEKEGQYNITAMSEDIWHRSRCSGEHVVKIGNQPPNIPTINGSKCGDPGVEYTYNFVAEDPEGHNIYYYIDWGDGTFDNWFGPFASGEEVNASHGWDSEGDYEIKAQAKDKLDKKGEWSIPYLLRMGNHAPKAPDIDGPPRGKVEEDYTYTFVTTDYEGDDIYYEIHWGDDTSDEKGPYFSGEEITASHIWVEPKTYIIKARARDEFCGLYSDWSEFKVIIPRSKPISFNYNLLGWLLEWFPNASLIIRHLFGL